ESSLYIYTLILVLSVTFFGAYLAWRDLRRELHLAAMRSQFVSSVSHELRTPLAAIRMFAETLRMGRAAGPETQAEYLDTIVDESERLTRLLDNVLDFSKIEREERRYKREPAALPEVVRAAVRTLHYPLSNQGFKLAVEIDESLPPISADIDAMEQAVLNLLTNAMKYSGDSREIHLKLARRNAEAVIQVIDRGIGIPAGEQARIFQKFYRIPTLGNHQVPGTGLGLTLVEHIAKAHGGRVEVESSPGKGSTFSIVLPLEEKP
ncbi:MAG TPA: ATP-binding protein, partial [Terriglobia bacterium]|nr:ATP-binding protein [Terriglobia bacterium]